MEFKTTNKGKKTLKNATDSRKITGFSLSTREINDIDRLSETFHYSKSSILSALIELASDPNDPATFNAMAKFFTDYEIARGQNVKKNKVSFNGSTACLNCASGGDETEPPLCQENSSLLVKKKESTNIYNCDKQPKDTNIMAIMRSYCFLRYNKLCQNPSFANY